jgi:hypothetical protein
MSQAPASGDPATDASNSLDLQPSLDIEMPDIQPAPPSMPFDIQKVLDELDTQMQRVRALERAQTQVARQAVLDPNDGVEM